jgi:hypothetical protein
VEIIEKTLDNQNWSVPKISLDGKAALKQSGLFMRMIALRPDGACHVGDLTLFFIENEIAVFCGCVCDLGGFARALMALAGTDGNWKVTMSLCSRTIALFRMFAIPIT